MKKTIIVCMACVAFAVSCGGGRNEALKTATGEVVPTAEGAVEGAIEGAIGGASNIVSGAVGLSRGDISIEKQLLYDQHTLADTFPYRDGVRVFQFDKMRDRLFTLDSIQQERAEWGILQNRKNWNGQPPNTKQFTTDEYHTVADLYGVERSQSAPLYVVGEFGS